MLRSLLFATALVVLPTLASAAEKDDPVQGTWIVVSMERGGRPAPKELLEKARPTMTVKGDTLRLADEKHGEGATFKRVDSKKPHTIGLVFKEGPKEDVERKALGIYELDGDSLKIAWRKDGGERPSKFASVRSDRATEFLVLKRAKPEKK